MYSQSRMTQQCSDTSHDDPSHPSIHNLLILVARRLSPIKHACVYLFVLCLSSPPSFSFSPKSPQLLSPTSPTTPRPAAADLCWLAIRFATQHNDGLRLARTWSP
ncbi:hypothetical protein RRG08_015917 [Elysia crispata]|uniref:Uncharacterized protein n=1 Tax=Elysia crispata TaxID=231223 RepID=A0AAE1AML1_9GAST|nr:hypothetical protein RRG08_015917 [Elysia crispata]